METINEPSQANDYAVAKALNDLVNGIMAFMYVAGAHKMTTDHQLAEINRAYILLTHELEKIYTRNPELLAIKPLLKCRCDNIKSLPVKELGHYFGCPVSLGETGQFQD